MTLEQLQEQVPVPVRPSSHFTDVLAPMAGAAK
jgi:hypothetical protein